jgi:CBS domain-containing protein
VEREIDMRAEDIMTREVVTISPDTTVAEAARLMLDRRISGLPVVDRTGALVGLVTEGDLLRRGETGTDRRHSAWLALLLGPGHLAREYAHEHGRRCDEVMARKLVTVAPETRLAEVVHAMERHRIKRVPVVQNERLVGIISRANLLDALARALEAVSPRATGDAAVRKRVLAEIDKQPWTPRASLDVEVEDGVVTLSGAITDERERAALRVLAENVPGVKGVRDALTWVEPMSGMIIPPPEPPGAAGEASAAQLPARAPARPSNP